MASGSYTHGMLRYLLILPVLALGCGEAPGPATAPTTAPAATQPASLGAMRLKIAGRDFSFTPAILVIAGEPPRLTARLYNMDQGGGRDSDAFYLECPLDLEPEAPLTEATHHSRTANRERTEALTGIFLPGERVKLQPLEIAITLAEVVPTTPGATPGVVLVKLSGQFLVFPDDADVATNTVSVSGTFPARVKQQ